MPHAKMAPAIDHQVYLSILPRIEVFAQRAFRHLPTVDREEAVAETVAATWQSFVRLRRRGKDPTRFVNALVKFSTLGVLAGRRVGNPMASSDVYSNSRRRNGISMVPISECEASNAQILTDLLPARSGTSVPDQAAFRVDFPAWLRRLAPLRRRVVLMLAEGYGTGEVAAGMAVTSGRVSQVRRELEDDWQRYHAGDPPKRRT
jgi:DNA-directed RNA polymerase specialized sigma24 family protein